jgi:ligand-binding sensor domain-containing protein
MERTAVETGRPASSLAFASVVFAAALLMGACSGTAQEPPDSVGPQLFDPQIALLATRNEVAAIVVVNESEVWTSGAGHITRWNPTDGTSHPFGVENGLPLAVWSVGVEGSDGSVWFASPGHVVRWQEGGAWEIWGPETWPGGGGFESPPVFTSAVAVGDDVWFGSIEHGLFGFSEGAWSELPVPSGWGPINDLVVDEVGTVWAAGRGGIAASRDGAWTVYETEGGVPYWFMQIAVLDGTEVWAFSEGGRVFGLSSGQLTRTGSWICDAAPSGAVVGNDSVWVGFEKCGLVQLLDSGDTAEQNAGLPATRVLAVEWRDSTLYVGTASDGLHVVGPDGHQRFSNPAERVGNVVLDLAVDDEGRLWAASSGGVILLLDGERLEFPIPGQVAAITHSNDGKVWFAASDGLVGSIDPTTMLVQQLPPSPETDLSFRVSIDIAIDGEGRVWIAGMPVAWYDGEWSSDSGLDTASYVFASDEEVWLLERDVFRIAAGSPPEFNLDLEPLPGFRLALQTDDGSLVIISENGEAAFLADPLAEPSAIWTLPTSNAAAATSDRWGRLWLYSRGEGLWCMGEDGDTSLVVPASELPLTWVTSIAHSRDTTLWLGGRAGITSITVPTGSICPSPPD